MLNALGCVGKSWGSQDSSRTCGSNNDAKDEPAKEKPFEGLPFLAYAGNPGLLAMATPSQALDLKLGTNDKGRPQLYHAKSENRLNLEQLQEALKLLSEVRATQTLISGDSTKTPAQIDQMYPELAKLGEIDAKYEHKLYGYLRDFRVQWDNVILLLALYTQKVIEDTSLDKKEKIQAALTIASKLKERIHYQQEADKIAPAKRGPSDYSLAVLDLTIAELYSQTQKKTAAFYQAGIKRAKYAIAQFKASETKIRRPAKPDYFSIIKGLQVIADLNIKVKECHRKEIARLRRQLGATPAPADQAPLDAAITKLEQECNQLLQSSYDIYAALANVEQRISLPTLGIDFGPAKIQNALTCNVIASHLSLEDRDNAEKGIYRQLKAVSLLKKAALIPQLRRVKNETEIIDELQNVEYALQELDTLLLDLQLQLGKETDSDKLSDLTKRIARLRVGFYNHFGNLVAADLTLALLDRLNFTVLDRGKRAAWVNFVAALKRARDLITDTPEQKRKIDKIIAAIEAELRKLTLDIQTLDQQRFFLTEVVVKDISKKRYEEIEKKLNPASPGALPGFKYLYAWCRVKQIEIAIRAADYVVYVDENKNIAAAEKLLDQCQALKRRWIKKELVLGEYRQLFTATDNPAYLIFGRQINEYTIKKNSDATLLALWQQAESFFEEDEYLAIELDYLETILHAYRYEKKLAQTANSRLRIQHLAAKIKRNADNLSDEQLMYFTYYATLKEAIALIQFEQFAAAAVILDGGRGSSHGKGIRGLVESPPSPLDPSLEQLAWDIHTLKAELYHELTIAYSVLERDQQALASNLTGTYVKEAYRQCGLSTSIYDREKRPLLIKTELKLGEDGKAIGGTADKRSKRRYLGR